MKVLISTDSSCLINNDILVKNGINCYPLNVIIDGQEFIDGITINQETLTNEMRANKAVKTSTPPMGEVIAHFDKLFKEGYDQIIHFTISSKLSSMYSLFTTVSESCFDGRIKVIDSYSVSSLMLSHVLFAKDELDKGKSIDEIVRLVEERKNQENFVIFIPENLKALKNGGRISPAIAAIGNTLGLKPLLALKDGALVKDVMTRNVKKAVMDRITEVNANFPINEYDYTLINFDAKENVLSVIKNYLDGLLPNYKVIEGIIPINVCAHCGPGTVGVLVTPNINGKSINEFL